MDYNKFWEIENFERGLSSSVDDKLYNIYRVIKANEKLKGKLAADPYKLLEIMKGINVPYFNGDEKLFFEIYRRIIEMTDRTIMEYINYIVSQGRFGAMVPDCLFSLMFKNITGAESILVTDSDKYGIELYDLIKENKNVKFYLTVKNDILYKLFTDLYRFNNVEFISPEIYTDTFTTKKFDLIVSFPIMGGRELISTGDFISRELSFIAAQNLLYHLTPSGKLIILLPAKIGFGGGDAETLRNYISENYKVNEIASLPSKVFYPYMSINTYLLSVSQGITDAVTISKYSLVKKDNVEQLNADDTRLLFSDELAEMNNWNVDMAFSMTDETILQYKDSNVKKEKLKDVADVFRGKSVTSKEEDGNIAVVNISNISETGIDYGNLDTAYDEERKIARYLLEEGDVLIATKGFAIKIAVFEKQPRMVIASSNLCVVRPNTKLINGTYLKLFLESETGMKLLKSLQRGTTIVNINYQDICELEVPVPPMDEQFEIANEYNAGLNLYKKTIAAAEEAWSMIKNSVKNKLF
jgi:hypothetical protein